MASKKSKRDINSYLKSARENKKFVPSLSRYSRRSAKLSRWEKAAITRAEHKIRDAASGNSALVPLSAKQAKALNDKSQIVGRGVRAYVDRNIAPNTRASVIKGELKLRINGRTENVVPMPYNANAFATKAQEIFDSNPTAQIWIKDKGGKWSQAFDNIDAFIMALNALENGTSPRGKPLNGEPEDFVDGMVWLVE